MVEIVSANGRWTARIDPGPAASEWLAQLPLELTLKDFAGTEKIADLPSPLTTEGAPKAITPRAGDVTYYAPWGNLAIFYRDGHHSPGLIALGQIEGAATSFAGREPLRVTIRKIIAPSQ